MTGGRIGRLVVAIAWGTLVAQCGSGPRSNTASTTVVNPPGHAGVRPVPVVDVSSMEAPVRDQLRARYSALGDIIHSHGTDAALATAYGELGQLLMASTYLDAAEAAYLNAQTLAPADIRWPYYLGHLYKAKGPLAKSVAEFEQALRVRPNDLATLIWLGDAYLAQGRPEAAQPLFDSAMALDPSAAAAHFGAGRVALGVRDYSGAIAHLEKALVLDPRATATHYHLGMAYRGRGDLASAEAHLARKGTLEPRPVDPLMRALDGLLQSAEAFNVRGGRELDAGNWTAAADDFRNGLALNPSDPSLRHRLGTALFQMGDHAGAIEQFREVIRSSPDFAKAHFSLGVVMEAGGRHQDAIQSFSNAVQHDPGYLQARLQLARALSRNGSPEQGLAEYQHALERDPALKEAVFGYAMTLVRLKRYREARDRLTDAMRTYPGEKIFRYALARLLAAAPDPQVRDGARAKMLVDTLLKTERSIDVGATAAMALAELGDYAEATAMQREVIAAAKGGGLHDVVRHLTDNLTLYERRRPCRVPFTDDELP